jgi:hypothetical protein
MISFGESVLDKNILYDVVINTEWDIKILNKIFSVDFNNYKPSIRNKKKDLFLYYTFIDNFTNNMEIDYDLLKNEMTNNNIYDDFFNHILEKVKSNKVTSDKFISEKNNIISFIRYKLQNESFISKNTFRSIHKSYNTKSNENELCSYILEQMLIYVPERFNTIQVDKIISLPFKPKDYFYKIITLDYTGIIRRYMIKINIV